MATRPRPASAPLTFDLPLSFVAKMESYRRSHGLASVSDVIRLAIDQYNFEDYKPLHDHHRQISVRISGKQRAMLKRYARKKHASVGELLRLALEGLAAKKKRK